MIVTTTRPRIWLSPAILADLKLRAVDANPRWTAMKSAAGRPADWSIGLANYALTFVITGDPQYAQKALSLLLPSAADGLAAITPDSGYQVRNALPAIAYCFDYLYPVLTAAQKSTLIATMKLWGNWVWPETNPARAGAWAVDSPGSNYFQAFMFTWLIGISLFGDDPAAQGYLDLARHKWDTLVVPYLQGPAQGGVWPELLGYGTASTGMLLWYLTANQTATGEDLIAATPWCKEMVTSTLHLTNPAMTEMAPLGDLGAGPIGDRTRRAMLWMAAHDSRCVPWLDAVTPARNLQQLNQWEEWLCYPWKPLPFPTGDEAPE